MCTPGNISDRIDTSRPKRLFHDEEMSMNNWEK